MRNYDDKKLKKALPYLITAFILIGMITISEMTGEREIIFPEVAALAIGYMISPKRLWAVSPERMLLYLTVCAIAGVMIVRFVPGPLWLQMSIAFAAGQVLYTFGGTSLAPFISAICLPVLLRTSTWIYPVSACLLSAAVILGRFLCIKANVRNREDFSPVNKPEHWTQYIFILLRIVLGTIIIYAAIRSGFNLVAAPPLLVAYTEFSRVRKWNVNPDGDGRSFKGSIRIVLVFTGIAAISALARFGISDRAGLPLTVSAVVIVFMIIVFAHLSKIFIPPVYAIAILALLIPEEAVMFYPLQICIGVSVFMASAGLIDGFQKIRIRKNIAQFEECDTQE